MLLFIDLLIIGLSALLISKGGFRFSKFSPIVIFFYAFLLYISAAFLLIEMDKVKNITLISRLTPFDPDYFWHNLFCHISLLIFSLGVFLSRIITFRFEPTIKKYSDTSPSNRIDPSSGLGSFYASATIFLAIAFCSVLLLFYQFGIPALSSDLESLRLEMIRYGGYKYILIAYLYVTPVILGAALTLALKRIYIHELTISTPLMLILITAFLIQISSILTGFRTYIVIEFYVIVMAISLFRSIKPHAQFILFLAVTGILLSITFLKFNSSQNTNFDSAFYQLIHRGIFDGYYTRLYLIDYVNENGLQNGAPYTLQIISMLPGQQDTIQNIIGRWIGTDFALAPTLVGDLYLNFGVGSLLLLVLMGLIFGTAFKLLEIKITSQPKNIVPSASLYIGLAIFLVRSVEGGLGAYIILISTLMITVGFKVSQIIIKTKKVSVRHNPMDIKEKVSKIISAT